MTDRLHLKPHIESALYWAEQLHNAVVNGPDAGHTIHPLRLHKASVLKSRELSDVILFRMGLGERIFVNIYPHGTDSSLIYMGLGQEWDYTARINTPCYVPFM